MTEVPKKIIEVLLVDDLRNNGRRYKTECYLCDNGGIYNKDELATAIGINANTLKVRFGRSHGAIYGEDILRPVGTNSNTDGSQPLPVPLPKRKQYTWDRSRCKRDSTICRYYKDCQNKRLGIDGAGEWEPPDNTDDCYKAIKHPGNLHAVVYAQQ